MLRQIRTVKAAPPPRWLISVVTFAVIAIGTFGWAVWYLAAHFGGDGTGSPGG
jgi:hypothetical protein